MVVKISKKIGREYRELAIHLNIDEHELDQIAFRRQSIQDISQDFLKVRDVILLALTQPLK